jgi:hypothetical protein
MLSHHNINRRPSSPPPPPVRESIDDSLCSIRIYIATWPVRLVLSQVALDGWCSVMEGFCCFRDWELIVGCGRRHPQHTIPVPSKDATAFVKSNPFHGQQWSSVRTHRPIGSIPLQGIHCVRLNSTLSQKATVLHAHTRQVQSPGAISGSQVPTPPKVASHASIRNALHPCCLLVTRVLQTVRVYGNLA